jgi:phospholipase D1/2
VWMSTAQRNTDLYQDVFGCIPADNIHSRSALRQAAAQRKEKMGHSTIDLGIAPEPLDKDGRPIPGFQDKQLEAIRGHLVNFPLNFMSAEDLRPVFKESEYYASAQIFH